MTWKCKVCGYIHEGDMPDGFKCPKCGAPREAFEKVKDETKKSPYAGTRTEKNLWEAFTIFFGAVILVIIGTYLLFMAGSVAFCKLLQKNKRYYYKPNHFVSVSSMIYRMRRNGAGLASICILLTMVLVMISATTSLYFGTEDALQNTYPNDVNVSVIFDQAEGVSDENI